jgi:elongation factor Ts
MANITPQMVKELREKTGAGMGDCKKALEATAGDMSAAIDELRKKGAASAAKRSDRSANEGLIVAKTTDDGKTAVIVEVNCETDFVARNQEFVNYGDTLADTLLNNNVSDVESLMKQSFGNDTIEGIHNEILAKFAEKIQIRRFEKLTTNGFIAAYIHAGSKLAVLIELNLSNPSEKSKGLIRDIAMQIAAMNPSFVDRSKVTQNVIDREMAIYREQALTEGKPEQMADRIAQGRLDKFYQEACLVEQAFVKDSKKFVKDVVAEISTDSGSEVSVLSFRRYFLGEEL